MKIRSPGGGMPLLQGIDIGSPYKAVTVSVAQTGTQKAADCYSNYTQSTSCWSSTMLARAEEPS